MSIKLHWFLPTTGDARSLVGGGHSVPQGIGRPTDGLGTANVFREPDIDYLATIARTADQLGYEGVLTPDRHVVRGRLAGDLGADPRDAQPEVPGRVPARRHLADPVGPDGCRVPADLQRPAAAQRGDGR